MKTINNSFVCKGCKRDVPSASKTCRNHCPYCFTSLHVDGDIPGDRMAHCHGIMKPVEFDFKMSGGSRILFSCIICGKKHWNKTAEDDELSNLSL